MRINSSLSTGMLTLKNLSKENADKNYVSWLNDKEINKFTESRFTIHSQKSVAQFIERNNASENCLLLGIFKHRMHIGNIRAVFEWNHKTVSIGLIIGNTNMHGQGIGSSAINFLASHIFENYDIYKVNAGLYESNVGSFLAFKKKL